MNKGNKAIRHEGNKRYRGIAFKLLKIFAIPQYIYTSIRPFFRFSIPPYLNTSIPRRKRSLLLAFSLIELTISLIIMSSIITVFTPIISKNLKSKKDIAGQKEVSAKCESINTDCRLCRPNDKICLVCDKTCESTTLNEEKCECE